MKNKKALLKKLANKTVHVKKRWWDPFFGVEWKVVDVKWNLTIDEYDFLTRNKYLSPMNPNPTTLDEVDLVLTEKALNLLMDDK